jgi:hypothetical protein
MEVRLKRGWQGHRPGAIVKVTENCANTLFQTDSAERIEAESQVDIRAKLRAMVARKAVKSSRTARREPGGRS